MGEPQFHLGDTVFKEINNKMIQCTIVPFPNGPVIIHNHNLREAHERNYSNRYRDRYVVDDDDDRDDQFTSDGHFYAFSDGVGRFYYLLLLPTGEKMIVHERRLSEDGIKNVLSRRVSNIHKKKAMNEFRHGQADKFRKHLPLLPGDINNHISSYLTQTPLSSHVNTRINNRLNPGTPSSAIPLTIAQQNAPIMNNISDDDSDEDTTNGGTRKLRKTRKTRKRRKVRKPRKIGKKRKTSKRRMFSQK